MVSDQHDPMSNASYRAAVNAARQLDVTLTAWREGRMWAVRADYQDGVRESVTVTARTAADAAWHAIYQLKVGGPGS